MVKRRTVNKPVRGVYGLTVRVVLIESFDGQLARIG